jgi:ubiquinone/menaquinone biosynthesis C-methylase UbiE
VWKNLIESGAGWMRLDLKHSQRRYFEVLQRRIRPGARWLDVGCGHQIVPLWAAGDAEQREVAERAELFAGADLDPAISEHPYLRCRVFARGEALPFPEDSFDIVTANMVVEHLEDPKSTFAEIHRVLRPNGKALFHTPNLRYPYTFLASRIGDRLKKPVIRLLEKREEKDVFPTHYRANEVEAVRALAGATAFRVDELDIGGSVGSLNELGPLGLLELPFLKLLSMKPFRHRNATIIAVFVKAGGDRQNTPADGTMVSDRRSELVQSDGGEQ